MAEDHKSSPDSKGLGWWGDQRFVVGCVEEVNGPGAVEIPGFVPTRHELIQLVKYWAAVEIDLDFDWFLYQCTSSSEGRLRAFAGRRIARIAGALGQDEVDRAVREVSDEFGKGCDPRAWNIFLNGTPEECEALQDEIQRELDGREAPEDSATTEQLMKELGVDHLLTGQDKPVRFAILPAKVASIADPLHLIVPVVHYLNADADGRYSKNPDGSAPSIEWGIRYLAFSQFNLNQIKRLTHEDQAVYDFDLVVSRPEPEWGFKFYRICQKARWKLNPELATQLEKAAAEASDALVAKLAGRSGVTIFDDLGKVLEKLRAGQHKVA